MLSRPFAALPLLMDCYKRSPGRYLITLGSLTLSFILFGLLYSISASFDYTLDWLSANSMRVTSRVNLWEPLPISHLREIEQVSGVSSVQYAALFGGYFQDPKRSISAAAIAADRVMVFPHMKLSAAEQGAMQRTRMGAIAGKSLAKEHGWRVGDRIVIICPNLVNRRGDTAWTFDIVGIYDMDGNTNLANELYVNYDYINEGRALGKDGVNIFIVRTAGAEDLPRIAREIDARFRNSSAETLTRSDREWVGSAVRRVGNVHLLVNIVLGAALFTLFILTRDTIAQSVRERTSEFGVLKVLGFSAVALFTLIVFEAVVLCLAGAILGMAGSLLVAPWFAAKIDMTVYVITPRVFLVGLLTSVLIALAASLAPGIGILRLRPAVALRKAN